jgi:hypothetical protein
LRIGLRVRVSWDLFAFLVHLEKLSGSNPTLHNCHKIDFVVHR